MADDTSTRGFARMKEDNPGRQQDIASQGGHASGGQFKAGGQKARDAGKEGAKQQPIEAKRKGGENGQRSS